MIIIGINAYHGDSSACIFVDGNLVAAVEEERLQRVKHYAGFPELAILECLSIANLSPEEVDVLAINSDPIASFRT